MVDQRATRRELLASGAGVLAGVGTIGGDVEAAIDSDAKPDHVSITYDEERLERWQPRLSLSLDNQTDNTGLYGYVASSDEWDHDVLCYWSRYAIQEGFLWLDSHQYDHEPIYLYVDASASEPAPPAALDRVVYSGYHFYSASYSPTTEDLSTSRRSDAETHISLSVASKHHHYQLADAGTGVFLDLKSWPAARPEWSSYGFYDGVSRAAVDSPIVMLDERETWWADGTTDKEFAWLRILVAPDNRDKLDLET